MNGAERIGNEKERIRNRLFEPANHCYTRYNYGPSDGEKIMLVTHGNHEFNVDMARTDSVEWVVNECTSRLHTSPSPGTFYWCVFVKYQSPEGVFREFVLESGLLYDKVRAFTQARKRARHFRRERYNEMEANKGPIIPNMKGWK